MLQVNLYSSIELGHLGIWSLNRKALDILTDIFLKTTYPKNFWRMCQWKIMEKSFSVIQILRTRFPDGNWCNLNKYYMNGVIKCQLNFEDWCCKIVLSSSYWDIKKWNLVVIFFFASKLYVRMTGVHVTEKNFLAWSFALNRKKMSST